MVHINNTKFTTEKTVAGKLMSSVNVGFLRYLPNDAWTVVYGPKFFFFSELSNFPGEKPGGDLGQYLLEKFSSRYWIRSSVTSCAPHTSFEEIKDIVVKSERGEFVRGLFRPLVHSAYTTAGDMWRAPTRFLL